MQRHNSALKHKKSINQSSFSLENYANSRGVEHDVPKTVVMYNKLMGGVDMADQLLTTYDRTHAVLVIGLYELLDATT
jgi:hypothetical protein